MRKKNRPLKLLLGCGDVGRLSPFPSNKLPAQSQKLLDRYAADPVSHIMIGREPLNGVLTRAANWLSGGELADRLRELGYDKIFHLFMIVTVDTPQGNVKLKVEKNERVTIVTVKDAGSDAGNREIISVDVNSPITFGQLLENTRARMTDHYFFQYNARDNNCQDFLLGILSANGLLTPSATKFIKQDAQSIFATLPGWASAAAQFVTDTAGRISELIGGADSVAERRVIRSGRRKIIRRQLK